MSEELPTYRNTEQPIQTPSPISSSPSETPKENHGSVSNGTGKGILFEIIFIIVFLILLFGTLNYFNILPLSKIWPNYLGFLPHKAYEQSNNSVVTAPTPTSTISLARQAKETLITFLPTILKPSLLPQPPSDINLTDKSINQTVSASWDIKDGRAITILTVSPNGKEISQLLIFFPYATTESVSIESAQSTIPKLFSITPKGKWACDTITNTANYCENFWEEQNGIRRGIALKEPIPLSQAKKINISFCEHSQKSRLYSWKSCAEEFAKTGVH